MPLYEYVIDLEKVWHDFTFHLDWRTDVVTVAFRGCPWKGYTFEALRYLFLSGEAIIALDIDRELVRRGIRQDYLKAVPVEAPILPPRCALLDA